MLPNVKEFIRPKSLKEATGILKKHKGAYVPLAGSTTLGESENPRITGLVDLSGLKLDYISSSGGVLSIGAMTTLEEIVEDKRVSKYASGVINAASSSVGKITNRNLITAGGNIVQLHPWSILPVVCLALDAQVVYANPAKKTVAAEEFLAAPRKILSNSGIVTEIKFPKKFAPASARFEKFSLTENDYPIVSVCVAAILKGGRIETVRISCGALALAPQRFKSSEKMLEEQIPDGKLLSKAADAALADAVIGNDIRVSKEYKKRILSKLILSNLREILK